MDAAEDPDPDGWPVHPAVALYGLWPRFTVDADEAADSSQPSGAGAGEPA